MVVHDCSPPRRELTGPFRPGAWMGLTYCAYIDFVLSHPDLVYYTVEIDCGCGVIRKVTQPRVQSATTRPPDQISRLWHLQRTQQQDMFDFFHQHRHALLNLISVKEFLIRENLRPSWFDRSGRLRERIAGLANAWRLLGTGVRWPG